MTDIELRNAAEKVLVEVLGQGRFDQCLLNAEAYSMSSSRGISSTDYVVSFSPGLSERFTEFRSAKPEHILQRLRNHARQVDRVCKVVKC